MLKTFEKVCEKIKDFTLISNACHQNIEGKIVMFVIFSQKQRLFFLRVKLYRSTSCKCSWFLLSWGDFKATWRAVLDKL